jgi:hypothetical protein
MLFIYLPISLLALIVAVKFFSLYEREVCLFLLCWLETLADKRARKRGHTWDGYNEPANFMGTPNSRLH